MLNELIGKKLSDVISAVTVQYPNYKVHAEKQSLLTSDNQPDRLNIYIDEAGVVTGYNFG